MSRTRMWTVGALCRSLRFSCINSPGILMSDSCFRHFAARSGKEDANYAIPPFVPSRNFSDEEKAMSSSFYLFGILSFNAHWKSVPEGDDHRQKSTEFHMGGLSLTRTLKMHEIRLLFFSELTVRCACPDS